MSYPCLDQHVALDNKTIVQRSSIDALTKWVSMRTHGGLMTAVIV